MNATLPAPYGPLVETCGEHGISRTKSFALAKAGLIETFTLGRKRFVYRESLRTLPERLAGQAVADKAVQQ